MPPQNDDVQGVSLRLTEEDIRRDCADMNIPYSALMAVAKRHRAANTASQIADVLYIMMLARSKGLNPIDDNYSLIAREGGGFGLTFNKSAALHVINNHPKVKKDAIAKRFIVSKGEKIDIDEHPERMPGGWKLADVDWDLTAIFEIEAAAGGVLRGVAKFRACFAAGRDGNPKFLWLKDPAMMTMKQAEKDLANTRLDGSLPEALPAPEEDDLLEAAQTPRSLPASTRFVDNLSSSPAPAPEPVVEEPTQQEKERLADRVLEKGAVLGLDEHTTYAAWKDQQAKGITLEAFEKSLDAEIEKRKPRTAAPAPRGRKPKAPPKPLVTVIGQIDAIQEKTKEATGQEYLVLSVQRIDMFVWDKKKHDLCRDAYQNGTEVKVSYVISGDDVDLDHQFADVREIEMVEAQTAEQSGVDQIASELPIMETEFVDPDKDKCAECGCSFGVHLKTCSKSTNNLAPRPTEAPSGGAANPKASPDDEEPPPLFAW